MYASEDRTHGGAFEQNRHPNLRSPEVPLGPMDMGTDFTHLGASALGEQQFPEAMPPYGHHYGYGIGGRGGQNTDSRGRFQSEQQLSNGETGN